MLRAFYNGARNVGPILVGVAIGLAVATTATLAATRLATVTKP